jgi:hypothetical protein
MMTKKYFSIALVAVLFLVTNLACSGLLSRRTTDTPARTDTPTREVTVSQEAAQEGREIVSEALAGGTLRMNEAQFTSLITSELAQGGGDVPLRDITVWFEPNQIVLQGNLDPGVVPLLSGQLVATGQLVADNGRVRFNIEKATLGGVTLPNAAVNMLNDQVNSALDQSNLGQRVRSITVNQGEIIIEQQ